MTNYLLKVYCTMKCLSLPLWVWECLFRSFCVMFKTEIIHLMAAKLNHKQYFIQLLLTAHNTTSFV